MHHPLLIFTPSFAQRTQPKATTTTAVATTAVATTTSATTAAATTTATNRLILVSVSQWPLKGKQCEQRGKRNAEEKRGM